MRKHILSLLAVPLAIMAVVSPVSASSNFVSLGVKNVKQSQTNWCWAATSQSVLDYYNIFSIQDGIVKVVKGKVVNRTATVDEVQEGLREYGLDSSATGSLSFSELKSELNADDPVLAGIQYKDGGGHMVVIDGYEEDGRSKYIEYMDPAKGSHVVKSYSSFKDNSSQEWFESIYNFSK
ncbi:papain-like cysteine protease family protein [Brevibacillus porteri]|uniref:Peptidase C39-like domain-containing protein n=1 Tax=Brevibacillus porteri TaxID=2126350 RepID=A0ABX5FFT2_9BACL|nr:papain-like cysteine protease family protein [Brevibacillus porteri]MED1803018.1 papain-like cysteine protease family protein [Brevibacillus porteri]MED2135126.1 papain-like cysteine protease family protein [Brevibacillus porteri]MED2745768.1 papain-like cysteine protease family protein [Brevibacillus porteri]MED2813768.1 papain-like cysteine protease family protein [Brevibacillus porteri]MED2897776.1 papain-like cysteine protease family protein [Brevibacillus porteri]